MTRTGSIALETHLRVAKRIVRLARPESPGPWRLSRVRPATYAYVPQSFSSVAQKLSADLVCPRRGIGKTPKLYKLC